MSQAKKQLKLADYAWTAGATTASSLLLAGVGLAGVANHLARKTAPPPAPKTSPPTSPSKPTKKP